MRTSFIYRSYPHNAVYSALTNLKNVTPSERHQDRHTIFPREHWIRVRLRCPRPPIKANMLSQRHLSGRVCPKHRDIPCPSFSEERKVSEPRLGICVTQRLSRNPRNDIDSAAGLAYDDARVSMTRTERVAQCGRYASQARK